MSRALEAAMRGRPAGLRERQPPVGTSWFQDQRKYVAKERTALDAALAAARTRERAARDRHLANVREIHARYRGHGAGGVKLGELRGAKRALARDLEAIARETQAKVAKHAAEVRKLVEAADGCARAHASPFAFLRTTTKGPGGKDLSVAEAAQLRAATFTLAKEAPFMALRSLLQAAIDHGDLVSASALVDALEVRPKDRPATAAEFVKLLPLGDLHERAEAAAAVFEEASAFARAWSDWASDEGPRTGDGPRKIEQALASGDPEKRLGSLVEELDRLGRLEPHQLRDLSDRVSEVPPPPVDAAPRGEKTIAGAIAPRGEA